ncbi:MAG: cytochrome c4 [Alphaproteobacteria bacterium]|nr:cytochrome c4 [Alphaproteobacteria bacterium]MDE1930090.1 cytochrome c4 [Alphaproteobacteria bacterium]
MPRASDQISAMRAGLRWTLTLSLALALAACDTGKPGAPPTPAQEQSVVDGTVHVCTSCHGFHGRSTAPTFPNLAGQQRDYIVAQLKAFRDHTRADPHAHTYMWGMAATLSDATIAGVAQFFSSQEAAPGTPGDPTLVAEGQQIYKHGIPDRQVPACQTCHGANGQGNAIIPRLAGQHPGYIADQLQNFASGGRANPIMHRNAKNLTQQETLQIAAYVGSL